jgi:hypothetical protein
VVFLEMLGTGMFLHAANDVATCRAAVDDVSTRALTAEDSLAVIALIKSEWETA